MAQTLTPKASGFRLRVLGFFCGVGLDSKGGVLRGVGCLGFRFKEGGFLCGKRSVGGFGREVLTPSFALLFHLVC